MEDDHDRLSLVPEDAALLEAVEDHLRRTGAAACLVRRPGTDFVIVAGAAETVFSLIEEDIEFYKHNGAAD
jgi:hypothetical protein